MDPDRLRTLIAILSESGVTYFETDEVTLHLPPHAAPGAMPKAMTPEELEEIRRRTMYGPVRG